VLAETATLHGLNPNLRMIVWPSLMKVMQ